MKRYKASIKSLLLLCAWLLLSNASFAQPDDEDVVNTPLDGGVTLLLAAGIGYGIKKARDKKKSNAEAKDILEK